MRTTYVRENWPDTTFEIETDRFGNYTIRSGGRVIKRVTSLAKYLGRPTWGSKKLELTARGGMRAATHAHPRRTPFGRRSRRPLPASFSGVRCAVQPACRVGVKPRSARAMRTPSPYHAGRRLNQAHAFQAHASFQSL